MPPWVLAGPMASRSGEGRSAWANRRASHLRAAPSRYSGGVNSAEPLVPAPLPQALTRDSHAGRTLVMGIVNVTPDSFSDGGRWATTDLAVAHGLQLLEQGADLVDIGGESTRPGAAAVSPRAEQERVLPVIRELARAGAAVSVDTTHAATAAAAVEAGAVIINDVSGGLADPEMRHVVAATGVVYICQHWRGDPQTMDSLTDYDGDAVSAVIGELGQRLDELDSAGAARTQVVIDPGLGFAKTHEQSWQLLTAISQLRGELGLPVLIGASRKRFLARVLCPQVAADPLSRDGATAAISALAAMAGAWAVRVHEVPPNRDAVRTASLWKESR